MVRLSGERIVDAIDDLRGVNDPSLPRFAARAGAALAAHIDRARHVAQADRDAAVDLLEEALDSVEPAMAWGAALDGPARFRAVVMQTGAVRDRYRAWIAPSPQAVVGGNEHHVAALFDALVAEAGDQVRQVALGSGDLDQTIVRGALAQLMRDSADHRDQLDGLLQQVQAMRPQPAPAVDLRDHLPEYLQRVRDCYRQLNLEVLLTMTDIDDRLQVPLKQVFIPQRARANPPLRELPREVRRRLLETGQADPVDLPGGMDPQTAEQLRQAYRSQPARPVLDVLADPTARRLVLLGDPGAGKSTLARYLVLTLAEQLNEHLSGTAAPQPPPPGGLALVPPAVPARDAVPILVELRGYADPRWRTFGSYLADLHASEGLGLPQAPLEAYLDRGGPAVVVFDGLDEIFDRDRREAVSRQVTAFADRHPSARVVLTSRPIGYQRQVFDDAGFALYELQDLDLSQIETFTAAWYTIACPTDAAEARRLTTRMLAAVKDSAAVAELAGNPLLLTLLAIMGRRRELPRDRAAVYRDAVSLLVEHWDVEAKHFPDQHGLLRQDKHDLLQLLARTLQDSPHGLAGNRITEPDLRHVFETYLRAERGYPHPKPAASPTA